MLRSRPGAVDASLPLRASVAVLLLGALVGCRRPSADEAAPPPGRGAAPTLSEQPIPAPAGPAPAATRWQDPMLAHPSEARPAMVRVEPQPLTETETVPGAPTLGPAPRDYAAELRTLGGDFSSCVPAAELAALPPRVELDLEATVTPSGVVSRSDARGASLSEDALRCLRDRVGAARFAAPVLDAPRRVTTHVVFDRRAAPAP